MGFHPPALSFPICFPKSRPPLAVCSAESPAKGLAGKTLEVLHACACIEEDDTLVAPHLFSLDQLSQGRQTRGAFRGAENSFSRPNLAGGGNQLFIRHSYRRATRRAYRIKNQKISNRARHAQTRSRCLRVRKFIRESLPSFKRSHDWRAARCLHCHHLWSLGSDPAHLFHLVKSLPHSDQ